MICLSACQSEVAASLAEDEANAIVRQLRGAGVRANKDRSGQGEQNFRVHVPQSQLGTALEQLHQHGLPRPRRAGLAALAREPGLMPSPGAEQARYRTAVAAELSDSLEAIPGVLRARVHLPLPELRFALRPEDRDRPARAAVLLLYRGRHRPCGPAAVERLVAGALGGAAPAHVDVVYKRIGGTQPAKARLAFVGPFPVGAASAPWLRALAMASLIAHILLAVLSVHLWRRLRRLGTPAA
ncbi:MAG: hypothetical protein ACPGUV_13315 [Polyangiales bacterium]